MIDNDKDQPPFPGLGKTPREIPDEEEKKRELARILLRQQQQQDQSLQEGITFLFRSIVRFVFYVVIGAFVIIFGRDLLSTSRPGGMILMLAGTGLIIKGMMSLGG